MARRILTAYERVAIWREAEDHGGRAYTAARLASTKMAKDGDCTCWEGYERVPGTEPCASKSCRKKTATKARLAMPWYHVSPHDLPEGTNLIPGGGGANPSYEYLYQFQPERQNHVWVDRLEHTPGWAGNHVYEVEPAEEPRLWDEFSPENGWVTPSARIVRKYPESFLEDVARATDDDESVEPFDEDYFLRRWRGTHTAADKKPRIRIGPHRDPEFNMGEAAQAWDGDKLVGYLSWHGKNTLKPGRQPEVGYVAVHPDYRRQGIARSLIEWARKHREPELQFNDWLSVSGKALAESMGYTPRNWSPEEADTSDLDDSEWEPGGRFYHGSIHLSMPNELDVYDDWYDEEGHDPADRPEPHAGPWYHYSPTKLPVGTHLTPGHDSPWGDDLYGKDGSEHRRNYVWLSPSVTEAAGWAELSPRRGDSGRGHLYRVEPSGDVLPWNGTGSDGWVADSAHIMEELSYPWKEPHTAVRLAMPWYHVSPHDLPVGTVLTPGGGQSMWDEVPHEQGGNQGAPKTTHGPKISDYVWIDGDREASDFRLDHYRQMSPDGQAHQYEVDTDHEPEDYNGEYAVPQATIKRRVSRRIAMPWRIEHPDYQPADVAHDYDPDVGSVRGGGDSRNYLIGPANNVWWHGSASGDVGGGDRDIGLHVGDYQTAAETLDNILGPNPLHPAGRWIGQHSLSEAYPGHYDEKGNSLKNHLFTHPDGTPMHGSYRPNVFPVAIVGPMANTTDTAVSDGQAHAMMQRQYLQLPKTQKGYYYINAGEGLGQSPETGIVYSVSATVPSASHFEKLDPKKYKHIAEEASNWETYDPPNFSDEEREEQERGVREWRNRHTAARLAMPAEDAYDTRYPREERNPYRVVPGGPWYHGSDHELPDGTELVPSGGESKWKDIYAGGWEERPKWVWFSDDPDEAKAWGEHVYEIEPTDDGPHRWNGQAYDDDYVAQRARVLRRLTPEEFDALPRRGRPNEEMTNAEAIALIDDLLGGGNGTTLRALS